MLGSLVGGMILVTNTRTLLTSDWINASDPVRYGIYAVLYAVWAAAVVHSYRQYRTDKAQESADALATLAEINAIDEWTEPNVVRDVEPLAGEVPAGRPSAPQD
jgi:hypothetical protein